MTDKGYLLRTEKRCGKVVDVARLCRPNPSNLDWLPHTFSRSFTARSNMIELKAEDRLSHSLLKELLEYDPATGVFHWKKDQWAIDEYTETPSPGNRVYGVAGERAEASNGLERYLLIRIKGHRYQAHRLAYLWMTGKPPRGIVKHLDGNIQNNSWENLEDTQERKESQSAIAYEGPVRVGGVWINA